MRKLIIIFTFMFLYTSLYSQDTLKSETKNYSTKPPVTVETLTKDCFIYDTLVDGGIVYQRIKNDSKGNPYYFIIVEDKKQSLKRKRIYVKI